MRISRHNVLRSALDKRLKNIAVVGRVTPAKSTCKFAYH